MRHIDPTRRLGSETEPTRFGHRAHMVRTSSPHGSDTEPACFTSQASATKPYWFGRRAGSFYEPWFGNRAVLVRMPIPDYPRLFPTIPDYSRLFRVARIYLQMAASIYRWTCIYHPIEQGGWRILLMADGRAGGSIHRCVHRFIDAYASIHRRAYL